MKTDIPLLHPVPESLRDVCLCDTPGCGDIATWCKDDQSDYPLFLCTLDARAYALRVEGRKLDA